MKLESKVPEGPLAEKWTKHKIQFEAGKSCTKKVRSDCGGTGLAGASAGCIAW